jgi:hypothetical protein
LYLSCSSSAASASPNITPSLSAFRPSSSTTTSHLTHYNNSVRVPWAGVVLTDSWRLTHYLFRTANLGEWAVLIFFHLKNINKWAAVLRLFVIIMNANTSSSTSTSSMIWILRAESGQSTWRQLTGRSYARTSKNLQNSQILSNFGHQEILTDSTNSFIKKHCARKDMLRLLSYTGKNWSSTKFDVKMLLIGKWRLTHSEI